jgi:hypothetical protein
VDIQLFYVAHLFPQQKNAELCHAAAQYAQAQDKLFVMKVWESMVLMVKKSMILDVG